VQLSDGIPEFILRDTRKPRKTSDIIMSRQELETGTSKYNSTA